MPKAKETILEINLKNLKHNFQYLKSKIHSNTKLLAVVKAFAYGSDAIEIAKYLQELDIDYFAVAYVSEGVVLRKSGITKPILVLHPQSINFDTLIENCLEPSIYSKHVLKTFIEIAEEKNQTNYPIHLKFNTGLNRLGFVEDDLDYILNTLDNSPSVKVKSIFSHLAASEDLDESAFTLKQIEAFKNISERILSELSYKPWLHLCNTSGILNYPQAHFDMVRSGIGLYGFGNSKEENKHLKPISTLKSIISQIHTIKKGDSVGYNRGYISDFKQRTATIPIGHADGIGRQYGKGRGYVVINGQKAPIIGNVCMDMIMINVTDIECQEGDEVVFFDETHTAEALAEKTNTISYELITAISPHVKRVFIK